MRVVEVSLMLTRGAVLAKVAAIERQQRLIDRSDGERAGRDSDGQRGPFHMETITDPASRQAWYVDGSMALIPARRGQFDRPSRALSLTAFRTTHRTPDIL